MYGSYRLYDLRRNLRGVEAELQSLQKQKADLLEQKEQLEKDIDKLIVIANQSQKSNFSDSVEGVVPKASATPVRGVRTANGDQVYDFQCWLDLSGVPDTQKQRIESVSYEFNDPTMHNKRQTSSDPSNGYAVGYRGWGAFHLVPITIKFKDGKELTIYLDMFKAIGWH